MILIDNDLVKQLLTMERCIEVQDAAFRQIPGGGAIHRPRIDMYVPCERDDGYYRWGSMEGANDGIFAIRMKSDIIIWPRDEQGRWTEEKYCIEPGTYCGLVFLFSTRNGEPLAIINDGVLQHMRVGGGAGLGVKYLARRSAKVVGMLGSGGMARTFLQAYCVVRDIERVKVFSPTRDNRVRYAEEMSSELGIEVTPVDTAREAVRGVDILSCCTDTMTPPFEAEWLEPGMHVANLNPAEVSDDAYRRFDVIVRQGVAGGPTRRRVGPPEDRGRPQPHGIYRGIRGGDAPPAVAPSGTPGLRRRFSALRRSRAGQGARARERRPDHLLSQYRQSGLAVLFGRRRGIPRS